MQSLVLHPAIVSTVGSILSFLLTVMVYRKHRFVELKLLSVGFLLFSIHPATFVLFSFLEGSEYNELRTIGLKIQVTFGLLGLLLIYLSTENLDTTKSRRRQYLLTGLYLYSLGVVTNGIQGKWNGVDYQIIYVPSYSSILLGVSLLWLLLELIANAYYSLRTVEKSERMPFTLILIGWYFGLFSVVLQVVERLTQTGTALYLIPNSLAFIFIAFALQKDPFSIVPRTIGGKSLIISDYSGVPLITFEFKPKESKGDKDVLFSGAMKGILTILQEITGRSDLPKELGYINSTIAIEKSDNYYCYFICTSVNNPVRTALQKILSHLENIRMDNSGHEINAIIERELYFAK